ncbi:hypothetical protein C8J57DRAFT_1525122 [Mycena rebaudengoi]|nr:hypothetical protein C8J57DRAFT_1525122 [Mycena rebaudengoi]
MAQIDGWVDVVVAALAFGHLSDYVVIEDVSWVYAALQVVQKSKAYNEEKWDAATEECVCRLLEALSDAKKPPSKEVLQVILKALSMEGPCSIPAVKLLCCAQGWFTDIDLQPIMQEHNVWSRMGSVFMNNLSQMQDSGCNYIELSEILSGLTQWTPYIHRTPFHWITIYIGMSEWAQRQIQMSYLSVVEHIWRVKYTGPYQFPKDIEKTLAWTLIALSIVWEGFDFSGQHTLQDFCQLIRCTISPTFKSHYRYSSYGQRAFGILISPNFRAAFYTPLGDSLIQAAKKARDMNPDDPLRVDNQLDLNGSLPEKTELLQRATTILDEMGQALKLESEGEQVDRGEERAEEYWDNLRTHFEQQVDQLEESVKVSPGTAAISH